MSVMTSQVLEFAGLPKTQIFKYLENQTFFSSVIYFKLKAIKWKTSFLAEVALNRFPTYFKFSMPASAWTTLHAVGPIQIKKKTFPRWLLSTWLDSLRDASQVEGLTRWKKVNSKPVSIFILWYYIIYYNTNFWET